MTRKQVLIFTIGFPYGSSEHSFLKEEKTVLSEAFDEVFVLPTNPDRTKSTQPLPLNFKVLDLDFNKDDNLRRKKSDYLFVFKLFLIEFFLTFNFRLFKYFRYHISELFVYLRYAKYLRVLALKGQISEENCLFYSYWFDAGVSIMAVYKLKFNKNIKVITRAHGFDIYEERSTKGYIFPRQLQIRHVDKIFPISQNGLTYLHDKFKIENTKLECSKLGTKKLYGDRMTAVSEDLEVHLVSCSSIIPVKRLHKVVEILMQCKGPVRWTHFGDGNLGEKIREACSHLPKNITYEFKGTFGNEEILRYYSENHVDYFINVSESEGIPMSIMEAISYGIPVIATNVGGMAEIVNTINGILIDKEFDPAKVAILLEEPNGKRFNRDLIVQNWEENYEARKNYHSFVSSIKSILNGGNDLDDRKTRNLQTLNYGLTNKEGTDQRNDIVSCERCILDTSDDPNLTLNEQGVCNYCNYFDSHFLVKLDTEDRKERLMALADSAKRSSKGKKYDCIIGLSGGADSAYVAYLVKELGLKSLAVHLDNGWNSELAVANINSTIKSLGIDLVTYVIDWEEIKDLQLSFLKASVTDIELINDFAIYATLQNEAYKRGIRYVFLGMNLRTEGEIMPPGWSHEKFDQLNIKAIHKKYGIVKLKTYPKLSFFKRFFLKEFFKLQWVDILNYTSYNKYEAREVITKELDWKNIGGKHFESIFTRFYQAYILPKKFKIDKRKFHLSILIASGQLSKEEALVEMTKPVYDKKMFEEDYPYVLKKLGLSESEFEEIMAHSPKSHLDYDSYLTRHYVYSARFFTAIRPLIKIVKWIQRLSNAEREIISKQDLLTR